MNLKELIIPPQGEGERVDRLIHRYFPELPEGSVRAAFLRRDIKLDGKRVAKDVRVQTGQQLRIYLPETENEILLAIIYEDADVMLVNKPAGISVEPDGKGGITLTDLCARAVREGTLPAENVFLPAACHRLDNQTSGCAFLQRMRRRWRR